MAVPAKRPISVRLLMTITILMDITVSSIVYDIKHANITVLAGSRSLTVLIKGHARHGTAVMQVYDTAM